MFAAVGEPMTVAISIMEESVDEGISTPMECRAGAVATRAEERMLVGEAFSRREVSDGSEPGGGCMSWIDRAGCRDGEDFG